MLSVTNQILINKISPTFSITTQPIVLSHVPISSRLSPIIYILRQIFLSFKFKNDQYNEEVKEREEGFSDVL